jgi:D-serine deaminase-like pyridoxal phosphate-dependent protein
MVLPAPLAACETPALVVCRSRLEANLVEMASLASAAGVDLRPHVKTHKCPVIARRQEALGATGLTCAKVSEAEVFAEAGCTDLRLAYPIVGPKVQRLRALRDVVTRLSTVVDSPIGVRDLAAVFTDPVAPLDVLIAVDVGYGREGVRFDDGRALLDLAQRIATAPGLALSGVLTHGGHAYAATDDAHRRAVARDEGERLAAAAATLREAGHVIRDVSVGSTPSARDVMRVQGVTEVRPGTYAFNDGTMIDLGVATPSTCALTVYTTVVSRPGPGRALIDAGSKVFSSDRITSARVLDAHGAEDNGLRLASFSEEHGWLTVDPAHPLAVGDRLRIIPGHVCPAVNLARALLVVDASDTVGERWDVAASGCVQ